MNLYHWITLAIGFAFGFWTGWKVCLMGVIHLFDKNGFPKPNEKPVDYLAKIRGSRG